MSATPPLAPLEASGPAGPGFDTGTPPQAALDREAYAELVGEVGEQAAEEILDVFISETDARLKKLRKLSLEHDRIKIGREAHSLKSAAGTFGYRRLAGLALRLEQSALRISPGEYAALIEGIEAAYAAAREIDMQH
jgi:HPt (histidine-containing phosphotransfer) domain-containing protein